MRELNTNEFAAVNGGIAPVAGLVTGGLFGALLGIELLASETGMGYGGNIAFALLAPSAGTIGAMAGAAAGYVYAINHH